MAAVVYLVGRSYWWIGLVLFLVLVLYMLVEFLVNGSVLLVVAVLLRLVYKRSTGYRTLNS